MVIEVKEQNCMKNPAGIFFHNSKMEKNSHGK